MQPLQRAAASRLLPERAIVSNRLSDLLQAHLAVIALLESGLISVSRRRYPEVLREQLEGTSPPAKIAIRQKDAVYFAESSCPEALLPSSASTS
jgi:hypothetical protein